MVQKVPHTKLEFEKQMCEMRQRLDEYIEGSYTGQVNNLTRQMVVLAEATYREHPLFLRGMPPMAWLRAFVNGNLDAPTRPIMTEEPL